MRPAAASGIVPFLGFDRGRAEPYYSQIYAGFRAAILEGRLRPGQRIPSSRALAHELGISRLPVLNALEQLVHEGFIVGRAGAGSFVSASIPSGKPNRRRIRSPRSAPAPDGLDGAAPRGPLGAFRVSLPALDQFPQRTWARLVARHARQLPPELMAYGEPAGYLPLRRAIADYLGTAAAVRCEPGQVLIVAGSQMALQLCARVLLGPGDEALVEEPGYPGARKALAATGAALRPVKVDDEGLIVRDLPTHRSGTSVVYVTPSHQYPLGMSMSASRRLELLAWAQRQQGWIIEDDYDGEYRFASRPLGALQGMDRTGRVLYVGTFSKVLFPALRIGYLVVPGSLAAAFRQQRDALDLFSPTLYQVALAEFLAAGHFSRHLRRMRAIYQQRRDALVAALQRIPGAPLTIANADAGMHLTAWLPAGVDDREIVRRAQARGISAIALSTCYAGRASRPGLVLGFGGVDATRIGPAVEVLAEVVRESVQTPRRPRRGSRLPVVGSADP